MLARDQDPSRIPEFSSIEEAAAFWDSHDFADFEDELESVELEVAQPLEHIISVRLESDAFRRLSAVARERGENMVRLAQNWVLEALDRAEGTGAVPADHHAVGAGLSDHRRD